MVGNQALATLILAVFVAGVLGGKITLDGYNVQEVSMKLTSVAFEGDGKIPVKYSCDHDSFSPALAWKDVPENVRSFAIIADDPDAPADVFVHWLIYNIPADARSLPVHVPDSKELENGVLQGRNDFRKIGYGGPCPPEGYGPHHYHFKLYALDTMLDLEAGVSKEELQEAIKGHAIGWAQLIGIYERPPNIKEQKE
jgi:Raf kinase inhibitor-like YbhB/YbcL family protein